MNLETRLAAIFCFVVMKGPMSNILISNTDDILSDSNLNEFY